MKHENAQRNMENYSNIINEAEKKRTERLTIRLSKHDLKTVERIAKHYGVSKGHVLRTGVKVLSDRFDIRWGTLGNE